jgi:hypothetical protein
LILKKINVSGQQATFFMQFEPHCLAQGEIVINSLPERVHTTPPGHGSASLRKADSSTLA